MVVAAVVGVDVVVSVVGVVDNFVRPVLWSLVIKYIGVIRASACVPTPLSLPFQSFEEINQLGRGKVY